MNIEWKEINFFLITRSRPAFDLKKLGINVDQIVMPQASVRSTGGNQGGPVLKEKKFDCVFN